MENCIFCKIAKGEIPCHKVWENENFLAFLDINPTVQGMTVVIPKNHLPSYITKVETETLGEFFGAIKKVIVILDTKLENVRRTKVVLEGLDVDHLHAKLYPMYEKGTEVPTNKKSPEFLAEVARKLRD